MIANMYVEAVQTAGDCSPTGAEYEVFAPITVFAPSGGTVTFEWQNTNDQGTAIQAGTIHIKPGQIFVNVVAYWLIGAQNPQAGGVTVVSGSTVLNPNPTPATNGGCSQLPAVSQDGVITVDDVIATPILPDGNQGVFSCPTSGTPLVLTTDGEIDLTSTLTGTQTGTISYYWQRSDGTTNGTPDAPLTATVNAGDTSEIIPPDTWTPKKPNHTNAPYYDELVITQVDGSPLPAPITTLVSNAAFFPDFCA